MKESNFKVYLKRVLVGLMIGIGGILPGVSGSVLAVAFGLYEPILDAIATFFKDVKSNLKFLVPVGIGGALGLFGVALVLDKVMGKYEIPIIFLFCGLVIGAVPSLIKEAKSAAGGMKKRYLIGTALGFAAMLLLMTAEQMDAVAQSTGGVVGPIQALIAGAMLAIGSILPGLSTSFILLRLGWYAPLMTAFTTLNMGILVWAGLGALGGAALTIGLVRWLIKRYPGWMYFIVLGLLAGSVIVAIPRVPIAWKSLFYLALMAAGAIAAYLLSYLSSTEKDVKVSNGHA